MAGVLKGYLATQSLPVGMDKKMAGLQLVNQSSNSRVEELSELSGLIVEEDEVDEREDGGDGDEDTEVGYHVVQREEAAGMPLNFPHNASRASTSYGAISPSRHHRKRKRRRRSDGSHDVPPHSSLSPQAYRPAHDLHSPQNCHRRYFSTTALAEEYGTEYEQLLNHTVSSSEDHHSLSSDEEDPPFMEMIYRRTFKDKTKLIIIPLLYFLFFVMAGVFAFYSIEALVESYRHRVRTVDYFTVDTYEAPGIAFFLEDFATYENCQFKYGDDLAPHGGNWTPLIPTTIKDNCSQTLNVTFFSNLVDRNRTALIFGGPTRVQLKQSLWLNFTIDMTKRQFTGIEFLLFKSFQEFNESNEAKRQSFLTAQEAKEPLYTVPAGFRSWIKMYYIIRNDVDGDSEANVSEFYINTDFTKYSDSRPPENRTTDPLVVLFEWKSPTYEYISDILSTTIWNTLGSLAGVFVTLIKAGEYFYAWIRRMKRERRKKLQKLQEMEEERDRMLAEYEQRREERRRQKRPAQTQEQLDE